MVAKVGALPPFSCVFLLMAVCKFIIIKYTVYIDYIPINSCNIVTMPLNFLCTSVAASLDVRLLTLELKSVQNR